VGEPSFIASQQKRQGQSTVFPWEEKREPWPTVARDFIVECKAIASGAPTLPPPPQRMGEYEDLRTLRIDKGLTQKTLAYLAGCSEDTVRAAETGKAKSTTIALIRRALGG
jgi:DNA-binding XRE family transcriptional regulator